MATKPSPRRSMDASARIVEMAYRIDHRHSDGSWGEMVEDRSHHSPANHDPERNWSLRRIFRCTSCEESVTLIPGEEGGPPAAE
jgi:hypothetical protein